MVKHHGIRACRDDPRAGAGSQVVDQVEWSARGVQHARERPARRTGQPAKKPGQDQQCPDDQVIEQHMESELLIGRPALLVLAGFLAGCPCGGPDVRAHVDAACGPFHLVNYLGSCAGARIIRQPGCR